MTPFTQTNSSLEDNGFQDKSLDEIEDLELREKVRHFREMCPGREVMYIERVIMTFKGDVNKTAALLFDDTPPEFAWKVQNLKKISQRLTNDQARDILIDNMGDLDEAKKHVKNELALAKVDAQIAMPPEEPTITAITSKSVHKPKPKLFMIDLNNDEDNENVIRPFLKPECIPSPSSIKKVSQGTRVSMIKEELLAEKVNIAGQLPPEADPICCEEMLRICDGDAQNGFDAMSQSPSTQRFLGAHVSGIRGSKNVTSLTSPTRKVVTEEESNGGCPEETDAIPTAVEIKEDTSQQSQEQTDTIPTKVEGIKEKVVQLNQMACSDSVEACDRNVRSAYDMLSASIAEASQDASGSPRIRKSDSSTNITKSIENEANKRRCQKFEDRTESIPFIEDSPEAKVDRLLEVCPQIKRVPCEIALQACKGDIEEAFYFLEIEQNVESHPLRTPAMSSSTEITKPIGTQITPPNTLPAQKEQAEEPSSQRSRTHDLVDFFANKLSSPVIKNGNEDNAATPMDEFVAEDISIHEPRTNEEGQGFKVEPLFENLFHNSPRKIYQKGVKCCTSNGDDALEMVAEKHGVFEYTPSTPNHTIYDDNGVDTLFVCPQKVRDQVPNAESTGGNLKRRSDSPLSRASKKSHVQKAKVEDDFTAAAATAANADYEDEDDIDETESQKVHLTPAGEWIAKTYPESSAVVLAFGQDKEVVIRDRIPYKVLYNNFKLLRIYLDDAISQNARPSKIAFHLPHVSPESFDLVAQFMLCGRINLENSPKEEQIDSILEAIGAAIKLDISASFQAFMKKSVSKLRDILIRDRLALKSRHIRRAYKLKEDGERIQALFVLASVRRFMEYKGDPDSDFEDDEDDDMHAAQQAAYSGSSFVFERELKTIPQYERAVWNEVRKSMGTRRSAIRRAQRGAVKEISVPVFTDPLCSTQFEL